MSGYLSTLPAPRAPQQALSVLLQRDLWQQCEIFPLLCSRDPAHSSWVRKSWVPSTGAPRGKRGPSGSEEPCKSPAVLVHIHELYRCGYRAAHSGCVTRSPCLVPIHLQAALLWPCSPAAICTCGWQGKSPPLSACPLIHPADKRLPACLADSTGRAAAPCQGLLKSSPLIDWPCHCLRDVFL